MIDHLPITDDCDGAVDADDAPEWTDEMLDHAELAINGKVIRPATGYLGPNGVVKGGPPMRDQSKQR